MNFRKRSIATFALCLGALSFLALRHSCYILIWGERLSNREFVSYRLDDDRRLLVASDIALLINTRQQVVVSLPPFAGQRLGVVLLWPRDRTKGVVLGDGVKGNVEDSYHFREGGVDIRYTGLTVHHDLQVPL